MNSPRVPRRRWQFSLLWLLVAILALGPVVGFGGPLAVRLVQQWRTPRRPPVKPPSPPFNMLPPVDYYESAETPLD